MTGGAEAGRRKARFHPSFQACETPYLVDFRRQIATESGLFLRKDGKKRGDLGLTRLERTPIRREYEGENLAKAGKLSVPVSRIGKAQRWPGHGARRGFEGIPVPKTFCLPPSRARVRLLQHLSEENGGEAATQCRRVKIQRWMKTVLARPRRALEGRQGGAGQGTKASALDFSACDFAVGDATAIFSAHAREPASTPETSDLTLEVCESGA
ncbi:uncharacterized protein DSM5745_00319 [Aspergillus mulundensis]|uniref:Uncharacterized protein n=1 Tax=Aspergillus mulundensis TaxID=1810919 RepID=A0A3D8T360_9EURO|nr:hypothetical protein DSM5745_00319 [Aspergillus mulundensis]RDW92997.1 hypothetical protein DSM5745_00319 [Aspergillus mulundensis]